MQEGFAPETMLCNGCNLRAGGTVNIQEGVRGHKNAFGFMRLVLASLVIVSHTPELVDGNRDREILTQVFDTVSFGQLAVNGFFVISGYLITAAFIKKPHVGAYLAHRISRIMPAFIVATLLSLLVVAPLGGASLSNVIGALPSTAKGALTLAVPNAATAFAGSHYAEINGSVWTIAYEFRCYLLVLALGLVGAFKYPKIIAAMAAACLLAFVTLPHPIWPSEPSFITYHRNGLDQTLRLTGVFLTGSCFYLWRDRIQHTKNGVFISAIVLFGLMFTPIAEVALATFGGYLIFAFALGMTSGIFAEINNKNDISYGLYLYAWPIEKLLIWHYPELPLLPLGLLTLAGALACGWVSWHALEKPIMSRVKNRKTTVVLPRFTNCLAARLPDQP